MDAMMQAGRFAEFVSEFINTINAETEETAKWDIFLHKVWDKTYNEFDNAIKVEQDNKNMSASEIETTIQMSNDILANFNPEERGNS